MLQDPQTSWLPCHYSCCRELSPSELEAIFSTTLGAHSSQPTQAPTEQDTDEQRTLHADFLADVNKLRLFLVDQDTTQAKNPLIEEVEQIKALLTKYEPKAIPTSTEHYTPGRWSGTGTGSTAGSITQSEVERIKHRIDQYERNKVRQAHEIKYQDVLVEREPLAETSKKKPAKKGILAQDYHNVKEFLKKYRSKSKQHKEKKVQLPEIGRMRRFISQYDGGQKDAPETRASARSLPETFGTGRPRSRSRDSPNHWRISAPFEVTTPFKSIANSVANPFEHGVARSHSHSRVQKSPSRSSEKIDEKLVTLFKELRLTPYLSAFIEEEVTFADLTKLSHASITALIPKIGPRTRFMVHVQKLKDQTQTEDFNFEEDDAGHSNSESSSLPSSSDEDKTDDDEDDGVHVPQTPQTPQTIVFSFDGRQVNL